MTLERRADGTFAIEDGASAIVVDDGSWPLVIATWFGEPTEPLVGAYFRCHAAVLERARSGGGRFVLLTDTFKATRPSPRARKLITDLTAAQPSDTTALTLESVLVLESAMMRGVMTAMSWIYPAMRESETVASIQSGIERSLEALDAAGIARPRELSPGGYRRPAHPSAHSAVSGGDV